MPQPNLQAELAGGANERLSWRPGPRLPRLARGEVHVWRADLTSHPAAALELLSDDERARAAHALDERRRLHWVNARAALRELLGRYLQLDPRELRLTASPNGKPSLPGSRPFFSLSHSGPTALIAVGQDGAIGVDLELARPSFNEVAIARRLLGPAQARRLAALEPTLRSLQFRRAWVRHEAAVKCTGRGLRSRRPEHPAAGAAIAATHSRGVESMASQWIVDLELGCDRYSAALAAASPPATVRRWQL